MIRAVRDTVLVKLEYAKNVGSIVLPDNTKQYSGEFYGIVISVGPEVSFRDELGPGDKILFLRHEGFSVVDGFEEYLSLREKWVQAKMVAKKIGGGNNA